MISPNINVDFSRESVPALELADQISGGQKIVYHHQRSPTKARYCTAAPGGPAFYAYSTNYLIDTEHGVIVDVEPTPAHRTAEVESTKTMINRVEARY